MIHNTIFLPLRSCTGSIPVSEWELGVLEPWDLGDPDWERPELSGVADLDLDLEFCLELPLKLLDLLERGLSFGDLEVAEAGLAWEDIFDLTFSCLDHEK